MLQPCFRVNDPALAQAAAEAESALARGDGDAYDCMVAALGRAAVSDIAGARLLFERALTLEPKNPAILTGFATFQRQQGHLRDAVLACDAAIRILPDYADAWLERGAVLAAGGSSQAAMESFAQAAMLAPAHAQAHAGVAALAARDGQLDAASQSAKRALALDPANLTAACALARVELETGNPSAAMALVEPFAKGLPNPSSDRSLARGLLGDALHALKRHDEAYAAYLGCNEDFAALNRDAAKAWLSHREFIEAIHAGLRTEGGVAEASLVARQPDNSARRHLFLLGYPRSGTTLLENILASIPGVHALEERPTLGEADRAFLTGARADIVAGLARFGALEQSSLDALRQSYWDKVVEAGVPEGTACFVDMDPLKGTRLPLIARLFPDARIILLRRDPRDVVWSCFRTNFAASSGALDFTTLEATARHYDALMRLTETAMACLPLNVLEVHYHRLVHDFDAVTREITEFAGLDWTESMRDFDRTAQIRGVSTASAGQVRKGLYDGTRQWEPYARYLEPVMPILQPWLDKLGYA